MRYIALRPLKSVIGSSEVAGPANEVHLVVWWWFGWFRKPEVLPEQVL